MTLSKSAWAISLAIASFVSLGSGAAFAQEAAIRKNLAERLPAFSKIDEVSKTPMSGLYEVRVNETDILHGC